MSLAQIAELEQTAERLVRKGDWLAADRCLREALMLHRGLRTNGRPVFELHMRRAEGALAGGRAAFAVMEIDAAIEHVRRYMRSELEPLLRAHRVRARCLRGLGREHEAEREDATAEDIERQLSTTSPAPDGPVPAPEAPAAQAAADPSAPERLEDVLAELDGLIGLTPVKTQVRRYVNFVRIQRARALAGHRTPELTYHLTFEGSPGTGKTTVARLFGRLMHALGALERGHVVETSRAELVAGYVGQTAAKVNDVVDRALDGVLFVDEAYALAPKDGGRDFGEQAISQLLIRMENDRSRLAVILAGYTEPMARLLAANPGLESRVAERIPFPDYAPAELAAIFRRLVEYSDYELTEDAGERLHEIAVALHAARDDRFGNARAMRNLFDDAIAAHADRLVAAGVESGPLLCVIELADVDEAYEEAGSPG